MSPRELCLVEEPGVGRPTLRVHGESVK
ncbi:hypothetical protein C347_05850 [Cryptococcus neoformans AD2-60a]|nr:hypothetical protein C347_05851 [Cryptococcus neoformans var. grubii AD2-60a]OWZ28034.1 hypothetical protein C347_05850 [Cryptococcus neoformans var. grubii AD2-60a]